MNGAGRFGSIGTIGFHKAALLAGVSLIAMALPAAAAPIIVDTDTTFTTAAPEVEDIWLGYTQSDVHVTIDSTGGTGQLYTSSGKSIYLGVSTASDRTVLDLVGTSANKAQLHTDSQLVVGNDSDDNTVTLNPYTFMEGQWLNLGVNAGSDGNLVELLSPDSSAAFAQGVNIGIGGANNALTLANGADFTTSSVTLGEQATASGNSLTVSSGSSFTGGASSGTMVGKAGSNNSIRVESGGEYKSGTASTTLGSLAGADKNSFTVTGAGSTYTELGKSSFNVGDGGKENTLTVSDGGSLTITDRLALGKTIASTYNTATVTGAGSLLKAGNVRVGVNTMGSSGNSLVVSDGGAVEVLQDIKIYGGNSIELSSGAKLDLGTGFETFANSTFALDVDSANAIDFDVTGATKLAGTFRASRSTGTLSNSYLVLSSTTGVTDNGIVVDDSGLGAGFNASLDFDGNDLYLLITVDPLGGADLGENQANLADAVSDAFAGGAALGPGLAGMLGVAEADLDAALAGGTGEINAFAQTELGWSATEAALGQLTGPALCAPTVGVVCVTAFATGDVTRFGGDAAAGNHDTTSFSGRLGVGAASLLSPDTLLTGVLSIDQTHAGIDTPGTADVTGFRFGGSLKQNWQDFYASFAAVGGLGMGGTERGSGFVSGSAAGDFTQAYLGARAEIGADVALGDAATLTPFVAVDWASNSTGAFTETGTGDFADLALAYDASSRARTTAEIGVRLATPETDDGAAFGATIAYRHVLTADNVVETRFADLPGYSFDVTPSTAPADLLSLSLDTTLVVGEGMKLNAQIDGSLGANHQSLGGKVGLFGQW